MIVGKGSGGWAKGSLWSQEKGEKGHFGERKDALIAQWRLASLYYKGGAVERDLQRAFLLINNVSKLTQGWGIYFCCANSTIPILPGEAGLPKVRPATKRRHKGRWVTAQMIATTLSRVEDALTLEELVEARKTSENWSF